MIQNVVERAQATEGVRSRQEGGCELQGDEAPRPRDGEWPWPIGGELEDWECRLHAIARVGQSQSRFGMGRRERLG